MVTAATDELRANSGKVVGTFGGQPIIEEETADAGAINFGHNMEAQVAQDVLGSAELYMHDFGPCPHDTLRVSEILQPHGQAFAGDIHLSTSTWKYTDKWGYDRIFRAHETAHQWWGTEVGWQTYHDQWLSEGFAEYSALMYLQAAAGNEQFMDRLKESRDKIFSVRNYLFGGGVESGAIALGLRTASSKTVGDYDLIVYKKGAFVLHMLRNLMLDFKTMSDERFLNMMRDWYRTFRGREASTWDFRQMVEKHLGMDMGWFFDEWVYGNDLPTYNFSYETTLGADSAWHVTCHITQKGVPESFRMYVPVDIQFKNGTHYYLRLLVDQPEGDYELPPIKGRIEKLRLNPFLSVLAKVE
ncbi:MAG: hypothetical protein D6800_05470 [Candidatus Zixiibacteriota bacterium]|nr:MAG: hypothetical protein D6800_05470 [candidate division Zixibacteria bacterium]